MCQLARHDKENEQAVSLHRNLSIVTKSLVDLLSNQVNKNEHQMLEQARHFAAQDHARQELEEMIAASLLLAQQGYNEVTQSMHNMQFSVLGIVSHIKQQASMELQSMLGEYVDCSKAAQRVCPHTSTQSAQVSNIRRNSMKYMNWLFAIIAWQSIFNTRRLCI